MRIVFMGTPQFAVPALKDLAPHLVAVVTQPDRRRGRGHRLQPSAVKEAALELGLPILQPHKVKDEQFLVKLQGLKPDLIVVVAFGQILPPELLAIPPQGCINLHASLLPRLRGAAPIQRAIMNGDTVTGVTTMYMAEGLDTGDIILQEEENVLSDDTSGTLSLRLAQKGADLLKRTIKAIKSGDAPCSSQDDSLASWAPPLAREDEILNWELPASRIANQIRALNPKPGAATFVAGKRLKIWRAQKVTQDCSADPGKVLKVQGDDGILVSCGEDALLVQEVQPAGKRSMSAQSYACGYRVQPGDVWG